MPSIAVVVIGRNEGDRLHRALSSVLPAGVRILYVDSGSTDDSVALARSLGVPVHNLDSSLPFSAARARAEGAHDVIRQAPETRYIQFLDGDCDFCSQFSKRSRHLVT